MSFRNTFLYIAFIIRLTALLSADTTPVLERTGKSMDPSIPTLRSVLGYDFGEQITRHAQMEKYIKALADASSQIKVQEIGKSYEGRTLYYLIISSRENMDQLEEIRQRNLRLSDPRKISLQQAEAIIKSNPVFVGLTYSVHGDEHSGVEAALALAYYLLASRDEETVQILKNCIVIIDPMQNPDGRERFIQHFYTTSGLAANPDPAAIEHHQPWPGGRTNHYLFDMNRDWIVLSQKETRARIQAYRQYQPHVFIDLHEMGENRTYFFPPPADPQNPNIPQSQRDWWIKLGKAIAADFDRYGIPYFTQEGYDFWYPGYGDSWPAYNGALSGTFEQGSVRGLVIRKKDESVVHYQDAIWHHFVSSLATIKTASQNREEKLRDFYHFRRTAIEEGKTGPIREFIIPRSPDPFEADLIVERLLWHGIEVHQADNDFKANVSDYTDEKPKHRSFQKGDYIIPMDQPLKRLIQVMFEKESPFKKEFLEAEEKRRKEKEETEIYDITAWSLGLSHGIDIFWSSENFRTSVTPITTPAATVPIVSHSNYAYLLNYSSNRALAAVFDLLKEKVRVHSVLKPFVLNGRKYRSGTFVIRVQENISGLREVLQKVARKHGVAFEAADTGWTEEGPDLGSDEVVFLPVPRIAVASGEPINPHSFGTIRYLFEQQYGAEYTAIHTAHLSTLDLQKYNVLILPDGSPSSFKMYLSKSTINRIKTWIENGGTLITLKGASAFLIDQGDLTRTRRIQKFKKDTAEPVEAEEEKDNKKKEEEDTEPPETLPGSVARAILNLKHFLTCGYDREEIPVFVESSNVFIAPGDAKKVADYASAERLKWAGLFWEITRKRLEKKAYITHETLGRGHVILFAEDPNFRAAWNGLNKLFLNGILLGPAL